MSNPTYIKLTGWVTRDPELRKTNGDQTPVCTIRVGTANRWPDRTTGEWREGPASYFDVVCWRSLAVNVAASLRKGHMVTIHGTFRNRVWNDKDNNPRTSLEITANSVGHELTYGWSHFNRTQRGSAPAPEELPDGETSRGVDPGDGDPGPGDPGEGNAGPRDPGEGDPGPGEPNAFDDAGIAEAAADEPRLEETVVPV